MNRKTLAAAAAALLVMTLPVWGQEAKTQDLPSGCQRLIADARACIPKEYDNDVRARINHALDLMADNIRRADPSERRELCMTTITTYRQMANLVCE